MSFPPRGWLLFRASFAKSLMESYGGDDTKLEIRLNDGGDDDDAAAAAATAAATAATRMM